MATECTPSQLEFAPVEGRQVVASFDGGVITSDGGALLVGQTDQAIRLTERFAGCFRDRDDPAAIERRSAARPRGISVLPRLLCAATAREVNL